MASILRNARAALAESNVYIGLNGGTADGFSVSDPTGYTYINILWDAVDFSNPPNTLTLINSSFCVDCGTNGTLAPWGMYYDQLVSGTATDPPGVPTRRTARCRCFWLG